MALGMKHWIWMAAGGCGLVALWLLPPKTYATGGVRESTAVELRYSQLRHDAQQTRVTLQRMRWSDSLSALALATAENGVVVGGEPSLLQPATRDRIEQLLGTEMSRLQRREEGTVVGVFAQSAALTWNGQGLTLAPREELYLGMRQGHLYCLKVMSITSPVLLRYSEMSPWTGIDGKEYSSVLGACRLVAEYGAPGPGIRAWLERGATWYGHSAGVRPRWAMRMDEGMYGPSTFGRRRNFNGRDDMRGDACRAGRPKECVSAFLDPLGKIAEERGFHLTAEDRSLGVVPWSAASPLGYTSAFLLWDLEQQFGPRRVQAFWTSTADVPTAFRSAFGQPLDQWLMAWVSTHERMTTAGPGLPRGDTLGALLLLAVSAIVGGWWAHRRRVA